MCGVHRGLGVSYGRGTPVVHRVVVKSTNENLSSVWVHVLNGTSSTGEGRNRQNREIARAGCWSWGLLRRPGSHQGIQNLRQRSSVPSVTEIKRRHRRRRAAAVLRMPRERIRDPRQDSGNHARWPRCRTRSEAPVPYEWPGLSIPVPSVPHRPLPARSWAPGGPAPPRIHYLDSTIFILKIDQIVAQKHVYLPRKSEADRPVEPFLQ
jgi:hypothetical protein